MTLVIHELEDICDSITSQVLTSHGSRTHNNVEANGLEDRVEVRQLVWRSDESSSKFDGFDFNWWWWVVFLLISNFLSL